MNELENIRKPQEIQWKPHILKVNFLTYKTPKAARKYRKTE